MKTAPTYEPPPPAEVERGQTVKPTADAIAVSGYRKSSRLVVRRYSGGHYGRSCTACHNEKVRAGIRRTFETDHLFEPGELYAAGKEQSSALCLGHVEPLADGES